MTMIVSVLPNKEGRIRVLSGAKVDRRWIRRRLVPATKAMVLRAASLVPWVKGSRYLSSSI